MDITYIGSGSAEGIPSPFCTCELCQKARKLGGKDRRHRHGWCVDKTVLIDFAPDITVTAPLRGVSLPDVTDILISHSHHDHFAVAELFLRDPVEYCQNDRTCLHLYGNDGVKKKLQAYGEFSHGWPEFLHFTEVSHRQSITTQNGITATFLPSRHAPSEHAGMWLLEKDGKRVLYGHDTGLFPEDTLAFLSGKPLDLVSLDTNYALRETAPECGHLGLPGVLKTLKSLKEIGAVTENTKQIASHITHFGGTTHEELVKACEPYGIEVAFDGMTVHI